MEQDKENQNLLLIFTRNPELGKVKSRLAADIGDKAALDIYTFLLKHTCKITKHVKVDKQVWYSENIPKKDLWNSRNFEKREQIQVKDLGARMENAFQEGFSRDYKNIIIIGSDLYDISQKDIDKAFSILAQNEAVIGPATDGGFYLLGLSKPMPELFKNKDWGTETVLKDTLKELEKYKFEQLAPKNDVDYLSDIIEIPAFNSFIKHVKND